MQEAERALTVDGVWAVEEFEFSAVADAELIVVPPLRVADLMAAVQKTLAACPRGR